MILIDTSVWINHLNPKDQNFNKQFSNHLVPLLNDNLVLGHPMVIGELACGNLSDRIAKMFMENVVPIDLQIEKLHQPNEQLTQARDLLLPRLMSGEVSV